MWFVSPSMLPFSKGNRGADTCRGCVGTRHSEVLIEMFFQWDSPFHKGLAWQRGTTDAACIITAVLISASDTSTAIRRYFQQKKNRNGSLWSVLSDLFRIMTDVFFFQRFSDVGTAKVEMADGLCKYSATCGFRWLISGCTWLIAVPFLYISYEIFSENANEGWIQVAGKVKDAGYPSQRPPLNPRQIMKQKHLWRWIISQSYPFLHDLQNP